jgi:hypothetical protein
MEIIISILAGGSIVWIVWKVRKKNRALEKAAMDAAWRKVLNDPHYLDRRNYEESKRAAQAVAANR